MSITAIFSESVADGNIVKVRRLLLNTLTIEKDFSLFDEQLNYAKTRIQVIESHDGEPSKGSGEWNEDYLALLCTKLTDNFSQERINHIKEVVPKVFPQSQEVKRTSSQASRTHSTEPVLKSTKRVTPESPHQQQNHTVPSGSNANPAPKGTTKIGETPTGDPYTKDSNGKKQTGTQPLQIVGGCVAIAGLGLIVVEEAIVAGLVVMGVGSTLIFLGSNGKQ